MAGPPPRISDTTRKAIIEAVSGGERRASVARRYQVSDTAVANVARAAGLVAPPLTAARKLALQGTIEVNRLKAQHRRGKQALQLFAYAERLGKQLWQPAKVYAFGRDAAGVHAYTEHEIPEPDAKAKQAIAISMGICLQRALELVRFDRDETGTSTVRASILQLVDRLAEEEQLATG